MIANGLYKKLSWGSQYCGKANEMCKGGLHVDDSTDYKRPTYPTDDTNVYPMPSVTVGKPILDVVIVVDGSDALDNEDWSSLKTFLVQFIDSLNTPEIQAKYDSTSTMVVVQFASTEPNYNEHEEHYDGVHMIQGRMYQLNQLEAELHSMIQMKQGSSAYGALEFVVTEVLPEIDSVRSEDHHDVVQEHNRILAMFVNGEPDDAIYRGGVNQRNMDNEELLHALDMSFSERFVIALGSEVKSYGSAYEVINKNSAGMPIYHLDGYSTTEDLMYQALGEAFLETLSEEVAKAALMYGMIASM